VLYVFVYGVYGVDCVVCCGVFVYYLFVGVSVVCVVFVWVDDGSELG